MYLVPAPRVGQRAQNPQAEAGQNSWLPAVLHVRITIWQISSPAPVRSILHLPWLGGHRQSVTPRHQGGVYLLAAPVSLDS